MKPLKLAIANKNYSSWSMRPWVLLTQAGIAFEEIQLKFEDDGKVARSICAEMHASFRKLRADEPYVQP